MRKKEVESKWYYLLYFCLESHRSLGIYPTHWYWHQVPTAVDQNYNSYRISLVRNFSMVGNRAVYKKITSCRKMSDFELTRILFLSHIVILIYLLLSFWFYFLQAEKNPSEQSFLNCHAKYEEMEVKALEPWLCGNGFTKLCAGVQSCWANRWDAGITVTNEA